MPDLAEGEEVHSSPEASATEWGRRTQAQEVRDRRRWTIQGVKDRVIGGWWSLEYPIPPEARARALTEIERGLSRLAVDELPESELVTIAEGIRDRIYQPLIQAQDRQRREEQRRQEQARRRADLLESATVYTSQELDQERDLDHWTRWEITQRVKRSLEEEIAGDESEAAVEGRVDELLDHELEAIDEKRRTKARQRLIDHGTRYATREVAQEDDLNIWERWRVERVVKEDLEHEITGEESEEDVEGLVDDVLDGELGEAEEDDEEDDEGD